VTGEVNPTAAVGFDRGADDYERGRPGYPDGVARLLADSLEVGPGRRVCDLAAGTGKFTRVLVDLGAEVVAIEPVAGMRAQLTAVLPGVECLDGTAEAIPLADASVDSVTVAQAFHWFDAPVALGEIRRVVRRGGGLALIWNRRDESVAWVAEMSRVIQWNQGHAPDYHHTDWKALLDGHGGFTGFERHAVSWEQPMTRDLLDIRVRSVSYIAAADEDRRQRYVDAVREITAGFTEPFVLPYVTDVFLCRTR
jgi:ubiquinone/menaquinone biosynthesis C-methylase UbiE